MTAPYWASEDGDVVLHLGKCENVLPALPADSVDAVVTDPPYELGFMGRSWDASGIAYSVGNWRAVLRVLKPGGHLLAFGGTRTWHRLVCAVEDAGFEVRDAVADFTGLDARKRMDVYKGIDILSEWKTWSESAKPAGLRFAKNPTGAGHSTSGNGSAPGPVLLSISLARSPADAIIAELRSAEAQRTDAGFWRSVLSPADAPTTGSSALVNIADSLLASLAPASSATSTAPPGALAWLDASREAIIRVAEALKILHGVQQSSRQAAIGVLCAALTDALKVITCAQSGTFRSYDTTSRTASACVTTVTITESTAASLISFMAGTLASSARGGDAAEASPGLAWIYGSGFP